MKELLDINENGVATYTEHDDNTDLTVVHTMQDCTDIVEAAKREAISGFRDKGIAGHIKHYCYLPDVICMEMLKKGINMMNPREDDWKKFFVEIETNYPALKTTEMKGWKPVAKKQEIITSV